METFRAIVHLVFTIYLERGETVFTPGRMGDVFFSAFAAKLIIHAFEMA